jgi:hypothetical protein
MRLSDESLLPTNEADADGIFNEAGALARRGYELVISVPAPPGLSADFECARHSMKWRASAMTIGNWIHR